MPGLGATDPVDLEAQARVELGFSWRLEQPQRILPYPGAAAILCGIVIGGDGDEGDSGAGAAGAAGVVVTGGGTKSVRRQRKMYSDLPGVHHALPEAALPR